MEMTFTTLETPYVTIQPGDPSFNLQGPLTVAPRASIEITSRCPINVASTIQMALNNGWIKCVATIPKDDPTYMWETLKNA
jgi:hypothetical protein